MIELAHRILSSKKFKVGILLFIAINAAYIAVTYAYPQLYDEEYHYEITNEFTNRLLPVIVDQPVILDNFGALERAPQLLYHYLLSFPLRFIQLFTDNFAVGIVLLRFINIALFIWGLLLSARLMKQMGLSPAIQNTAVAFVGLLPVSTFLASTINYDNLLFPVIIYTLIVAARITGAQQTGISDLVKLLIVLAAGVLIKISYLPVALIVVIYVLIRKRQEIFSSHYWTTAKTNAYLKQKTSYLAILVLLLLSAFALERYLGNIVLYQSISPSCVKQLEENRCGNSIIERRDKLYTDIKSGAPNQIPQYMVDWYGIMQRDSLSVNTKRVISKPEDVAPLPVLYIFVSVFILASFIVMLAGWRSLMKLNGFTLFTITFTVYLAVLLYTNISAYYLTYVPMGVQSRYILIFFPVIAGMALHAAKLLIDKRLRAYLPAIILGALALYVWSGAGITTYVSRSSSAWYWQNTTVRTYAENIKKGVQPVIKEWWYER